MDVETANQTNATYTGGVELRNVMANAIASQDAGMQPTSSVSPSIWPQVRLTRYLGSAFFFDPFRHSEESLGAQESSQLAQDGANLAQVLFTLRNNDESRFEQIEDFVQAALPDVGKLETRVEGSQTRAGFLRPAGGYWIPLKDMGGGIEQLLMTATILMTTGDESTLFLEEPESHLHAGAQRFLIERLYSGDRQVFIASHSPTFVNISRPRSLYQVTYRGERTTIDRLDDADSLGVVLEDIGARNSDVLLSDAVLFVEGPSDRDVLHAWSKKLSMSLEGNNVTVLPMGGGEHAEGKARVRDEILERISKRAPVPHLLVLDSDERSPSEIEKLKRDLKDKVKLLERREIENYLMVPRALLDAIRDKHSDDTSIVDRTEQSSAEEVQRLIETTADSLYGVVLLKRIRAALEGLRGGLLPSPLAIDLAPKAHHANLARLLRGKIKSRVNEHLEDADIEALVDSEREALSREWSRPEKRLQLAPGEEILTVVFHHFGSRYNKSRDAVRIANQMRTEEIAAEIQELLARAVALTPKG